MTLTTYLRTLKSIRQWLSDIVRDIRVEAEHCNPVRKAIYIYIYIYIYINDGFVVFKEFSPCKLYQLQKRSNS